MLKLASLDMEPRAGGLGYVFGISLLTRERDEQGWIAYIFTVLCFMLTKAQSELTLYEINLKCSDVSKQNFI